MTYREAEEYINETPKFTTKNKPEHTRELLRRLGNPQESFQTIHVAGSNGKGSVCAMINSALMESGKRCGLFTSPHLVCLTERFQINGKNCSEESFLRAFDQVMDVIGNMRDEGLPHPTFFEMLFAIGMKVFANEGVEIAVIETGLGGRLDATNILSKPLVCIITSISLEHTEYLGDTLDKIAAEKAGIIKYGVPVVFDAIQKEVADVIFQKAKELLAPVYPVYPGDIQIVEKTPDSISFCFDLNGHHAPVTLPFVADYQAENGALAMQACELLIRQGIFSFTQFKEGMRKTKWPGRMQLLEPGVYLDGAHNVDGITQFIHTVSHMGKQGRRLLFAMVKEKDYEQSIMRLSKELSFSRIVVTQIEGERMLPASVMAELFAKYSRAEIVVEPQIDKAYEKVKESRGEETVFCTGSLYLIGEIIRMKEEEND
ncbi:MAG: bifunctional folylpolyglutamate synthase/dihydrofolate synthase [Lachnospiraceae bacterium]